MQLPQIFQTWRRLERLVDFDLSTLARAVVHDGHAGLQRKHDGLRVRPVQTVVRRQVEVHGADVIGRTHQIALDVPQQIAKIDRTEFSVGDHASG